MHPKASLICRTRSYNLQQKSTTENALILFRRYVLKSKINYKLSAVLSYT